MFLATSLEKPKRCIARQRIIPDRPGRAAGLPLTGNNQSTAILHSARPTMLHVSPERRIKTLLSTAGSNLLIFTIESKPRIIT